MQSSLQRRFVSALGVCLFTGFIANGYVLKKFKSYEENAANVMSGDQKAVLRGHVLESKIKAAEELIQSSFSSPDDSEAFKKDMLQIGEEIQILSKDEKSLDTAKKLIANLISSKSDSVEDLFIQYRNLKSTAFNLYRLAWANKWMNVARSLGLMINDLDNLPYHAGEKAVANVSSKIVQATGIITSSSLPQQSKLFLFSQLNNFKVQVAKYLESFQKADKVKSKRIEDLRQLAALIKHFNESQGKSMVQFSNAAHSEVFKAILAFLSSVLFGLVWYFIAAKRFSVHFASVIAHVNKQMASWVTPSGSIAVQSFSVPPKPDAEFSDLYQTLDHVIRKINSFRKEDLLVKRLLNVPFLLVNRNKQAIFWNSALSILGKIRALEEVGPVNHSTLLRFTDANGKAIDPVDRALSESKEISHLLLLKVGNDGIAVSVVCTPVLGPDHNAEYVMVHLRDLREENRRTDIEIEKQLNLVAQAMEQLKSGITPVEPVAGARKPIWKCIEDIRSFALDLQEKNNITAAQIETIQERMERESQLKKNVCKRMEQLKDEIVALRTQTTDLVRYSSDVSKRLNLIDSRGKSIRRECFEIRGKGNNLLQDLSTCQSQLAKVMAKLEETKKINGSVRANEKVIHSILEKSTILNANNSILGSKREVTPGDVITITENIGQLLSQFERSYRLIEKSVDEVEYGVKDLVDGVGDSLTQCLKIVQEKQSVIRSLYNTEKLVEADTSEIFDLNGELLALDSYVEKLLKRLAEVEQKSQRLLQIGQASVALQEHLELGMKGMADQALRFSSTFQKQV